MNTTDPALANGAEVEIKEWVEALDSVAAFERLDQPAAVLESVVASGRRKARSCLSPPIRSEAIQEPPSLRSSQ